MPSSVEVKRNLVETDHPLLSIRRQCELLGLNRSSLYYEPASESEENLRFMRLMDEQYTRTPFFGSRRMQAFLDRQGYQIGRDRVRRLMMKMGLEAICAKRKTSIPDIEHKVYPYLLRNVPIMHSNHVWSSDISYIPMKNGFMYLVAIIDWYSRYVLSWKLSNTLDVDFCLEALQEALSLYSPPEIFNTDQGSQFTSVVFTDCLKNAGIKISMDGRGRCLDNIFCERLWRSVKYEDIYIKEYDSVRALFNGLCNYFCFYNQERPHQSLQYLTPKEVYVEKQQFSSLTEEKIFLKAG